MWENLTRLVPPIPQDEIQEWEDEEWEKPERHAGMVHLCTAEPPKKGRSDENLNEARKTPGDRQRVTNLGGLEVLEAGQMNIRELSRSDTHAKA